MLERLTVDTFAPLVGQTFRLRLDDGEAVDALLESTRPVPIDGWRPPETAIARQPFALQFLGPAGLVLPQRIYRFEHDALGTLEIFIVPVGRTDAGVTYEAVFS